MTFRCDQASKLTSEALDRKLTPVEFVGLWIHRAVCGPCRIYRKQMLILKRRASRLEVDPTIAPRPMDGSAKDRIRERLHAAAQSDPDNSLG